MRASERMKGATDLITFPAEGFLPLRLRSYTYAPPSFEKLNEWRDQILKSIDQIRSKLQSLVAGNPAEGRFAQQIQESLGNSPTEEQIELFGIGKLVLKEKSTWPKLGVGHLMSLRILTFVKHFDVDTLGKGFDNCLYVAAAVHELGKIFEIDSRIEGGYTLWGTKNNVIGTHYLVKTKTGNISDPLMAPERNGLITDPDKYESIIKNRKR